MIDFQSIEYFFSKKKYILKTTLYKPSKKKYSPAPSMQEKMYTPSPQSYIQKKIEEKPPISKIQEQHSLAKQKQCQNEHPPAIEKRSPKKKLPPAAAQKDHFYDEWKNKYTKISADNLLTSSPFKRKALFIVDKNSSLEFAKKIYSAVNTRLMDTTFIIAEKPLEDLIKKYSPTHLIITKAVAENLPLPGLVIENLSEIEKSNEKKKELWNSLKDTLKK